MVSPYLKNRNLNNDFGLRGINIVNELFGDGQLCGCVAYDDRISAVHLLYSLQVKQLAQPGDNFGELLRKHGVAEIEGSYNLILEIATLLRLVRNEDNDVARHWRPKCLCLHADYFKRLLEGDVCKLDRNSPCGQVRIEDHRQPSQLGDRLNDGL